MSRPPTRIHIAPRSLANGHVVLDSVAIDNAWREYQITAHPADPVILDFSSANYVEHDALLFLGGIIGFRTHRGLETMLELPSSDSALDFLRAWLFPEFLAQVGGGSLADVLTPQSLERLRRSTAPSRYMQVTQRPGGGYERLLQKSQFEITPVRMDVNPDRAATILQDKWLERHFVSILNRLFMGEGRGRAKRIATHIVLECVMNSVQHPGATMAYTSSQIIRDPSGRPRWFEWCIWDDGEAMPLTLRSGLRRFGTIRSAAFGITHGRFEVEQFSQSGRKVSRVLKWEDQDIPGDTVSLGMAAFMPGVTSNPTPRSPQRYSAEARAEIGELVPADLLVEGGLGLYVVLRTALSTFDGEIRYSTGNYRYYLSKSEAPQAYRARVYHRIGHAWPVKGNLLTIRLPLSGDLG